MAFEERSDEPIITYEELLKILKANDRIQARHQEVGSQPPYLIRALDEILIYSSDQGKTIVTPSVLAIGKVFL